MSETGAKPVNEVVMTWNVPPLDGGESTTISVAGGQVLLFVGANGVGKSALSHWMSLHGQGSARSNIQRIVAHRRVWLSSSGAELTSSQREQFKGIFASSDRQPESRIRQEQEQKRTASVLYDLLARLHARNAEAAQRYDAGLVADQDDGVEESVISRLTRVLDAAGLGLRFNVAKDGGFEVVRDGSQPYPLDQMSDGEKATFLLGSEVLLAPDNGVVLVDEPERHLHRAISADFILALLRERQDCAFILFSHDLELIRKVDKASTSLCIVRGVSWAGPGQATGWDIRQVAETDGEPDAVRLAILGGRERLLFVEGTPQSIDSPLYELVFPDRSVVASGGADEVKRAVGGLLATDSFHWVDGRGVLDRDARSDEEVAALFAKRVLVLPVSEVENLLYVDWLVAAVAARQAETLGIDAEDLAQRATESGLRALKPDNVAHLASVNALKVLRRKALEQLPSRESLSQAGETISITIQSTYDQQRARLEELLSQSDYCAILREFSVRDSGLLNAVAKELKFPTRTEYESAVRSRLRADSDLLERLRRTVGDLPE